MNLQLSDLSYDELKSAIQRFHSFEFDKITIADADKLLRLIIKHFPTQTFLWKRPIIYRARKHIDVDLFQNVDALIYPKNPKTLGRLNDIGESLFYGASHRDTAILEMRPNVGDEITILESKLMSSDVAPKLLEVGIRELMTKQNYSPDFIQQNREKIESVLGTDDNKKRYGLVNDFLIKEITKIVKEGESNKYKGTIAIGQFYIKDNPHADGMLYPSISRSGADCIAIRPDSYDKLYRPDRCFKCKVVSIDSSGIPMMYCSDNSTSIDDRGKITWT